MTTLKKLQAILEETGHHPLGPSSAPRWMNCPGSLRMSIDLPDISNIYAEEGTKAHNLAEHCLTHNADPLTAPGDYPDDMREHIREYILYVTTVTEGRKLWVEQPLRLEDMIPGCKGTADVVAFDDRILDVIDLKYGIGKVEATSPQLRIYAIGALNSLKALGYKIREVRMHIFQPRNGGGSTFTMTPGELTRFAGEVKRAAARAMEPKAPLVPSTKACEWCKAKSMCPALYNHNLKVVSGDFEQLPNPETLSDNSLRRVLENKVLVEKWLKAVEAHVTDRLMHGIAFDGFKVVHGRSLRKWADNAEEELTSLMGDNAWEKKLITIGKAEKVLGKKHLAELGITEKPPGKLTVVPETDRREAVTINDDFGKLK